MVAILWRTNAVDEIALSIAANGYYEDEPLLVIPTPLTTRITPPFVVVEGNRRLAAIKLLLDPGLRDRTNASGLSNIDQSRKEQLQTIPVSLHATREDLWTHIGFRHINGIKPWDGLGKSRYIAQIRETYNVSLDHIAERIGDRHATVQRLYRGFRVVRQAGADADFQMDDTYGGRFYFSHLYTALAQREYQDFLGINPGDDDSRQPIPTDCLPQLKELLLWLFGSKRLAKPPLVARQYPDLNNLREVISFPQSLAAIRNGYPLDTAYSIALGDTHRFRESVFQASESLKEALGTLTVGYGGEEDLRREVSNIHALANKLLEDINRQQTP